MEMRLLVGYGLLALLIATLAYGWVRWRKQVRKDRMMRWRTTDAPSHARRRDRE